MKKFIICTMLMAMAATSFCQETNSTQPLTKQDYLKKSKDQKTAALVLVGVGGGLIVVGIVNGVKGFDDWSNDSYYGRAVTFSIIGAVGVLSSIPLFIASHRNKRKAMRFSFKNESAPQLLKNSFAYRFVPSLSLKILL
jgi:O-antigen/teichoic acid export membrane protein